MPYLAPGPIRSCKDATISRLAKQALRNWESPLRPYSPRWRWRFLRGAIDGMFFQHAHRFCDRAFELRIAAGDDVFGPVFDIDIGRDAFIFHRPFAIAREEAATGSDR